ncbi:hypothetical protein Y032_0528g2976 [Ancylostoma ceylanicum]|uniref:Uncharacterized protein n=1 Tax=Ancylostoma ceylanicum TaxID=53326 RepID=A0A016WU25_9BILA|nr:hypothetical protein Y032_0528g2976 [Ancylostoma ceylanicum]
MAGNFYDSLDSISQTLGLNFPGRLSNSPNGAFMTSSSVTGVVLGQSLAAAMPQQAKTTTKLFISFISMQC